MYSDGSGQNGQIGMGVVLYVHRVEQGSLRKQLGSKEWHTIFETKVLGPSLAVVPTSFFFLAVTCGCGSKSQVLMT